MKKLILITALLFAAAVSQAQTIIAPVPLKSTPNHVATDTVVNATPKYQYVTITGYQSFITVATVVTKIGGTLAGTVNLEGSLDGVTYFPITGASAFTLTDVASQKTKFEVTHLWVKYRLNFTGSGTMSAKANSYAIWRTSKP